MSNRHTTSKQNDKHVKTHAHSYNRGDSSEKRKCKSSEYVKRNIDSHSHSSKTINQGRMCSSVIDKREKNALTKFLKYQNEHFDKGSTSRSLIAKSLSHARKVDRMRTMDNSEHTSSTSSSGMSVLYCSTGELEDIMRRVVEKMKIEGWHPKRPEEKSEIKHIPEEKRQMPSPFPKPCDSNYYDRNPSSPCNAENPCYMRKEQAVTFVPMAQNCEPNLYHSSESQYPSTNMYAANDNKDYASVLPDAVRSSYYNTTPEMFPYNPSSYTRPYNNPCPQFTNNMLSAASSFPNPSSYPSMRPSNSLPFFNPMQYQNNSSPSSFNSFDSAGAPNCIPPPVPFMNPNGNNSFFGSSFGNPMFNMNSMQGQGSSLTQWYDRNKLFDDDLKNVELFKTKEEFPGLDDIYCTYKSKDYENQ